MWSEIKTDLIVMVNGNWVNDREIEGLYAL